MSSKPQNTVTKQALRILKDKVIDLPWKSTTIYL